MEFLPFEVWRGAGHAVRVAHSDSGTHTHVPPGQSAPSLLLSLSLPGHRGCCLYADAPTLLCFPRTHLRCSIKPPWRHPMKRPVAAAGSGGGNSGSGSGCGGSGKLVRPSRGSGTSAGSGVEAPHGASRPANGNTAASGRAAVTGTVSSRNGAAADEVVVTYQRYWPVPFAARAWFPLHDSAGDRVPVTLYGRGPDGCLKAHNVTVATYDGGRHWYMTGIVGLNNHLEVYRGDRIRMTREVVPAAGGGAAGSGVRKTRAAAAAAAAGGGAAGGVMGVVLEKVAGQQGQQHHRRRLVRTAIDIGTPKPVNGIAVQCRHADLWLANIVMGSLCGHCTVWRAGPFSWHR